MPQPALRGEMEERTRQIGDVTVHFTAPKGQTVRPEDALRDQNTYFTRGGVRLNSEEATAFLQGTFRRNGYTILPSESLGENSGLRRDIWVAMKGNDVFVFEADHAARGLQEERAKGIVADFRASLERFAEAPAGGTTVAAGGSQLQARAAAVGMSVSEYQDFQKRLDSNPVFEGVSVEDYVKVMNSIQDALGSIRETIRSGPQLNIAGDPAVSSAILNLQNTMIEAARRAERER